MNRINAMESFLEENGLFIGWLCEGAGIVRHRFDYALGENAFCPEDAAAIERFLHSKGTELLRFKFGRDHAANVEHLRDRFGISKIFLARKLGLDAARLIAALDREGGFRIEELEILSRAVQSVAREMLHFRFPQSLKKAA